MFGDGSRDLVMRGIAAAKAGQRDEARRLLERALASEPAVDDMIRAWRSLSEITDRPEERRPLLEKLLAADPSDGYARRELAVLGGQLRRDDVIDPERFLAPEALPHADSSRAFACPRCGSARMAADPMSASLVCQHCGHCEPIATPAAERPRDVTAALWTSKGRNLPRSVTVFECEKCGASFLAAAEKLSASCPYCRAAYVTESRKSRDLIDPGAILPFRIAVGEAQQVLANAGGLRLLSGLQGVYVPAWLLTFSGEVAWKGLRGERHRLGPEREAVSGVHTVIEVNVCVPASSQVPATFHKSMHGEFDWRMLVPFDGSLLANWPAESYQVNLEVATVAARQVALTAIRAEVEDDIEAGIDGLEMTFAGVVADVFQLVLVPLWFAEVKRSGKSALVFVNGQSGATYLPKKSGLWSWLSSD